MAIAEPMFLALTALAGRPVHGSASSRRSSASADERIQLKIGSLYGVLDRLTAQGLVALDREEVHQGRLRRHHRLTDEGAAPLEQEAPARPPTRPPPGPVSAPARRAPRRRP